MDLGAYAQIEDLSAIMAKNNIHVPRLRGLRLMKNEEAATKENMDKIAKGNGLLDCEFACCNGFRHDSGWYTFSSATYKLKHKYLIYDNDEIAVDVNWHNIHGKKRKLFKHLLKQARKKVYESYRVFNKYCGRDDVLYIHARIGGGNWVPCGGPELTKEPWFIEKVDDSLDSTYCDIYAKIDPSLTAT